MATTTTTLPAYTTTVVFDNAATMVNFLGINDLNQVTGFLMATGATIDTALTYNSDFAFGGRTGVAFGNPAPTLTPAATSIMGVGINNLGIVDGIYLDANGVTHGWISNVGTNVDAPNTAFNQLLSINDFGNAVGYSSDTVAGQIDQVAYERQVYNPNGGGTLTTPNYININTLLPKNFNSQATGVADNGEVVGFFLPTAIGTGNSDGFIDNNGSITVLQVPGSTFTQALGVNNSGTIVGFFATVSNGTTVDNGFVYNPNTAQFTTVDVASGVNTGGAAVPIASTVINSVNDEGKISGFVTDTTGGAMQGFTGTPVANPVSVASVQAAADGILRQPLPLGTALSDVAQITAGSTTLSALEQTFITNAGTTTTPAVIAYDWFFGSTPGSAGVDNLSAFSQSLLNQGFSAQNVWVNLGASFAQNTTWGSSNLVGQTTSVASMTSAQFIAAAYQDIFGTAISASAQSTFANSFSYYSTFVQQTNPSFTASQVALSAKGAIGGLMLSLTPGMTNGYGAALTTFYQDAANHAGMNGTTSIYGVSLRTL
jgi:hypothetical protein